MRVRVRVCLRACTPTLWVSRSSWKRESVLHVWRMIFGESSDEPSFTMITCVYMHVCACMYVCMYVYLYMCCVPIRPPIPYIFRPHAVKDLINFVLLKLCFIKGLTQGSSLVTTLIIYFFKIYEVITSYFSLIFFFINIHTSYVLIRPPIPYITSSRCKRLYKFCPKKFLLHKRANTSPPPFNDLNNLFF